MGEIVPVQPVTPILGMIFRDARVADDCLIWVEKLLGEVGLVSDDFAFDATAHYAEEMGDKLLRRFYSFDRLADPAMLADWKVQTNRLEVEAAAREGGGRPLNLDPGYITGARLVLASVKGLAHRVYVGRGIYGEVTMSFRREEWIKRDYTFPDFATGRYDQFFTRARERHLMLLHARATGADTSQALR